MVYFDADPDAKEHRDLIDEFHSLYPNLAPLEIFESKVKPILEKAGHATEVKQSAKEKATLNISNAAASEPDLAKDRLERFEKSGHIDDAAEWLKARLFNK